MRVISSQNLQSSRDTFLVLSGKVLKRVIMNIQEIICLMSKEIFKTDRESVTSSFGCRVGSHKDLESSRIGHTVEELSQIGFRQ